MSAKIAILLLAALPRLAFAGSRAWEATLVHQGQHDSGLFTTIPIDNAGFAVRETANNDTADVNNRKRWLGIKPGQGFSPTYTWPDKTIKYCYDSPESRNLLKEPLENAFKLWELAGLSSFVYKYSQVANPGRECTENPRRSEILVVSASEDELVTTIGRPPLDELNADFPGPSMKLCLKTDMGQLNVVANFAHELGHAWGLLHEHQNRRFWQYPYSGTLSEGNVFGARWDCSALRDYHNVRTAIDLKYKDNPDTARQVKEDVCKSQSAASNEGFSAADWLPLMGDYLFTDGIPLDGAGPEKVDWESIMLYPSGAGGHGYAAPGTVEDPGANDHRQPVLLRNDGQRIRPNAIPSPKDIEGIKKLYEVLGGEAAALVLPNDKRHKFFPNLMRDFTGKKNQHCAALRM